MNGGRSEPSSWRMISWTTNNNAASSGYRSVQDDVGPTTITNRVTLRFRPIAPKPAHPDPSSAPPAAVTYKPRKKRRYVRARNCNRNPTTRSTKRKHTSPSSDPLNDVVTLQLLPEHSHPRQQEDDEEVVAAADPPSPPRCNLDLTVATSPQYGTTDLVTWRREEEESWVTVESVAEISLPNYYCMCVEEARMRLGGDTCPGFVSDGYCNRVEWVNGAYRRMVAATAAGEVSLRVRVVMKDDEVAACFGRRGGGEIGGGAYTCWVRVRGDTWRKEMVPCDVWRLENGGLAWRLDVESALTLGPG